MGYGLLLQTESFQLKLTKGGDQLKSYSTRSSSSSSSYLKTKSCFKR